MPRRYRFLTIRPGNYSAGAFQRAAHIHFDVEGRYLRLVTQMYFPGAATAQKGADLFTYDVVLSKT